MGKAAGFTLEQIAGMSGHDGRPDIPRDQLREKADELQRQMAEPRTLRDILRHVADCPAPSHLDCPTFRKLMQAASRRRLVYRPSVRSGAR